MIISSGHSFLSETRQCPCNSLARESMEVCGPAACSWHTLLVVLPGRYSYKPSCCFSSSSCCHASSLRPCLLPPLPSSLRLPLPSPFPLPLPLPPPPFLPLPRPPPPPSSPLPSHPPPRTHLLRHHVALDAKLPRLIRHRNDAAIAAGLDTRSVLYPQPLRRSRRPVGLKRAAWYKVGQQETKDSGLVPAISDGHQ